jgi:hypothetical protein
MWEIYGLALSVTNAQIGALAVQQTLPTPRLACNFDAHVAS